MSESLQKSSPPAADPTQLSPLVEDITPQIVAHAEYSGHLRVFQVSDSASGLRARIAVHSLVDGRALGGCRRWDYDNDAAWSADVLRLSRGMTRKAAVAGLPLGGAKAAINHPSPTPAMMRAFGRAIDLIEKQHGIVYITAEDVGITEELLRATREQTPNVRGIAPPPGDVPLAGGDPGPFTAFGVFTGIRTAVRHRLGRDTLAGVGVAVQGLGDVGYYLCDFLSKAGARLFVADLDRDRLQKAVDDFGAMPVVPEKIRGFECDVFAPCAMGGVLTSQIRAAVVAGSANNQQKDELTNAESKMLFERGILYAPDYVINAGGLISVYHEGAPTVTVMDMIAAQVDRTLERIFTLSQRSRIDTATIADQLAESLQREIAPRSEALRSAAA